MTVYMKSAYAINSLSTAIYKIMHDIVRCVNDISKFIDMIWVTDDVLPNCRFTIEFHTF